MIDRIYSADELEVFEEVGRGGFGIVYRGIVKATNEEVAIKQIDLENDQTELFEINKEILIISECKSPQITRYLGCFARNYKLWVVMEFVNGGSLFELLKAGPVTDEKVISGVIEGVLLALEYLHQQGKIHRDLKSQNVLISTNGEVKLTDFGVSTQLASNFSRRNTTVGTPYWMAPEVILNNDGGHSFKADIWSLGCLAYELYTGKPPLQNTYTPMQALRQISSLSDDNDFVDLIGLDYMNMSATFSKFLRECFVVDASNRSSATKLLGHSFITKHSDNPTLVKSLRKIITRKKLWDQSHPVSKPQNLYIPTEGLKEQKIWKEEIDDSQKTIHFDISSIDFSSDESRLPANSNLSKQPSTRESSASPPAAFRKQYPLRYNTLSRPSTKRDNFNNDIKQELNRILNKVFNKLENKNVLTTKQYDLLVSLNETMLSMVSNIHSESTEQNKLLICQHLKYVLKELAKPSTSLSRTSLSKMIIPSTLSTNKSIDNKMSLQTLKSRYQSGLGEIENSLFETWIDNMNQRRNI